jgi:hypothetical protein
LQGRPSSCTPRDFWNSTVTRVDPATGSVVATIPLKLPEPIRFGCDSNGSNCTGSDYAFLPFDLAAGEGAVWASSGRGYVARIDPTINRVSTTIKVEDEAGGPGSPLSIVAGNGAVWVGVDFGVLRIDPASNATRFIALPGTRIAIPGKDRWRFSPAGDGLALTGETLYAAGEWARPSVLGPDNHPDYTVNGEHGIAAIDTETGTVVSISPLEHPASVLASADGALWLSGTNASALYRFDPKTRSVAEELDVHGKGTLAGTARNAVWVVMPNNILRRLAVELKRCLARSAHASTPCKQP